jgi:drug/metabolite transporter (DMT)-like permease
METWVIWAIFGAIFWWIFNFFYKVIAQREYDTYVVTAYSYIVAFIISLIWYIYTGNYELDVDKNLVILALALWNIIFFYLSVISRIEALRNIDTVVFYPLYKTFGPIFVTSISIFYFRESLELLQIIWILVGISIPLLLINQNENKIQKNMFRWLIFLWITVLWGSISPIFPKLATVLLVNMDAFVVYTFFMGIIFSYLWYKLHHRKEKKIYKTEWIFKFAIISWIIQFCTFYTYNMSMQWNLAVAFTINSFSILIPIILSIIFYWEHFNLKKWIVIALSVVSILLFI